MAQLHEKDLARHALTTRTISPILELIFPLKCRGHRGTSSIVLNHDCEVHNFERGGFIMALPHHSRGPGWTFLAGIHRSLILGILIPFVIPLAAAGTIVNLSADQDNTMYADNSLNSNGAGDYIFAGATDNGFARRALVRFDVSAIPPGSTINSVSLRLFCSRAKQNTGYQVALHRLLADWGEGTSHAGGEEGQGAPATLNDATWTYRLYPGSLWSSPGGDYFAIAS